MVDFVSPNERLKILLANKQPKPDWMEQFTKALDTVGGALQGNEDRSALLRKRALEEQQTGLENRGKEAAMIPGGMASEITGQPAFASRPDVPLSTAAGMLKSSTSGLSKQEDQVFDSVGNMLRSGIKPPEDLLKTYFQVIGKIAKSVGVTEPLGEPAKGIEDLNKQVDDKKIVDAKKNPEQMSDQDKKLMDADIAEVKGKQQELIKARNTYATAGASKDAKVRDTITKAQETVNILVKELTTLRKNFVKRYKVEPLSSVGVPEVQAQPEAKPVAQGKKRPGRERFINALLKKKYSKDEANQLANANGF